MFEALFAPPWWMVLAPAVAAAGLVVYGLMQANRRHWVIGLIALAVFLLWFGIARLVHTPVEQALEGTRTMVAAVVAGDAAAIDRVLHPRAVAERWNRASILSGAPLAAANNGIQSAIITGTTVSRQPPDTVVVNLRVLAQLGGRGPGGPLTSDWQFEFIPDSENNYKLVVIRLVNIAENAQATETVRRMLQRAAPTR
jgi:hypothetical protein